IVAEAMQAGASGLSSSAAPTHNDIYGRPVPSRIAEHEELLQLVEEVGLYGSGSICFLPASSISGLVRADMDYLIELGRRCGLPIIIQGLGGRSKADAPTAAWDEARDFLDEATAQGAPIFSMLIARPFDRAVNFDESNHLWAAVP